MKKFLLIFFIMVQAIIAQPSNNMYFAIPADEFHFDWLKQLIGSIHKHNFDDLNEIAVFDLGFTEEQLKWLDKVKKLKVFNIPPINNDMSKKFIVDNNGKQVRGWYSWKPSVLKMALDMYPYVLYLDSGCVVLKHLKNIFSHIQETEYLFVHDQYWSIGGQAKMFTIGEMCVTHAVETFNLLDPDREWILDTPGLSSGIQGLTNKMYDSYVMPMYEVSKDINNFKDDGSAPLGFGWARHDQTIASIQARLLGLCLTQPGEDQLTVNGQKTTVRICHVGIADNYESVDIAYQSKGVKTFEEYVLFDS